MRERARTGHDVRPSEDSLSARSTRRAFLGLLATGASTAIAGTADAQEAPVVAMENTAFDPIGLHVDPGTTVRFEIESGSHSATAFEDRIPTEASAFDSGVISTGGFEHTFDVPGTYDYYCIPHESMGMVGRVVVGEPDGPAEQGSIPEGAVPDSETIVEQGAVSLGEFDGVDRNTNGGMMGPGMMDGDGPGWMVLVPIGFFSVLLASVAGVAYWASRRGAARARDDDPAMASLRDQYARGEIDEEEFQRRRGLLQGDE